MSYLTSALIESLENKVEEQIAFSVKVLQNLPEYELATIPETGGWSIVQILDHLNSYGDYYLPLINSAIASSVKQESIHYKSGWLGDYFIKMISPDTGTKKMTAAKRHLPKTAINPNEVVREFIRQEELLLQYLFQAKSLDLASSRIPISIANVIRLRLGDILLFVINHVDRHLVQVNKLISVNENFEVEV